MASSIIVRTNKFFDEKGNLIKTKYPFAVDFKGTILAESKKDADNIVRKLKKVM